MAIAYIIPFYLIIVYFQAKYNYHFNQNLYEKVGKIAQMLQITKDEAKALRDKIKYVHITKTRYKRYVEESESVKRFLNKLRNAE